MTDFGVTPEGFNKKTLQDILTSINDRQRAAPALGPGFDTSTSTAAGQINGIMSSDFAELWELLEEAYHGTDPDAAEDYLLTALSGLTGTVRRAASPSRVPAPSQTFSLNAGATIPAGSLVARAGRPDIVFKTLVEITNSGGSPAVLTGEVECISTGPIDVPAGQLTVIVNPITGWTATTNLVDASLGRYVDSDITLRQRRIAQLQLRGGSTVAGIEADLLDVDAVPALADIRDVIVLENTDDVAVGGIPAHAFEAVIDDGDTPTVPDNTIAQVIWDSRPAGIKSAGSSSGTATDKTGDPQTVAFSRVTLKPVYIGITVATNADFPIDGVAQVKDALVAYGATFGIGDDVIALALRARSLLVAGVTDAPVFTLGFAPAPAGTVNLPVSSRERATFSTTNIVVSVI